MASVTLQSDDTTAGLAQRAAGGDRDAFVRLVETHYDFVFRIAYRWCGRQADAEDIAQDVCARLGRSIRSYRGGSAFSSWLYAVTLNAARDWGRRAARDQAGLAAFAREGAETQEEQDPADALWEAVRALPEKQREAVTLIYGEGLSHAKAAELMACAEATVSWHVHEARKRLKRALAQAEEA
ncbi:MAG: RNA polymerase subunit sigma-70 [Mesorhizobium amorphae]|nr:MAG: RNA polymerase subunit sigma-70 [Mesorhizobium amorphae]